MDPITVNVDREASPFAGTAGSMRKITPNQRGFLLSLIDKKYVKPGQEGKLDTIMKCLRISEDPEKFGMSFDTASTLIDWFVKQPDKPKDEQQADRAKQVNLPASMNDLPDGYYAVRGLEGHKNEITFYRLRSPKHGRWVGYQFTDQVVGHGKRYPVKDKIAREKVHVAIREMGATESQKLYGQEIGACGRCGRELTDDNSRRFGIGPDCRKILDI